VAGKTALRRHWHWQPLRLEGLRIQVGIGYY
jgi:hypothetical protein